MNTRTSQLFLLLLLIAFTSCKEQINQLPNQDEVTTESTTLTPDLEEQETNLEEATTESAEIPHYLKKENFTVLRVIITNDQDEVLLCNDQGVWGLPWVNLTKRQFLNESIDSMAMEYGIEIKDLELRGQFCFKYDYKPNVTFRNYYVAAYKSGKIKLPSNALETKFKEVVWNSAPQAIEKLGVTAFKEITNQILSHPNTIWGGSFMVSHTDTDHPTKLVENFYPLAQLVDDQASHSR